MDYVLSYMYVETWHATVNVTKVQEMAQMVYLFRWESWANILSMSKKRRLHQMHDG